MIRKFPLAAILALATALLAVPYVAKADSFNLNVSNGAISPSASNYGVVTVSQDSTSAGCTALAPCIGISVSTTSGYGMHNDDFGFNIASGFTGISVTNVSCSGSAGVSCSAESGKNMSTFGSFDDAISGGTGSSSYVTSLSFDVATTTSGGFTSTTDAEVLSNQGYYFAAQITPVPCNSCGMGFAGANTENLATTPEPGTLVLFGGGLLGIAGFIRRKARL